jgi:hypothetical protein
VPDRKLTNALPNPSSEFLVYINLGSIDSVGYFLYGLVFYRLLVLMELFYHSLYSPNHIDVVRNIIFLEFITLFHFLLYLRKFVMDKIEDIFNISVLVVLLSLIKETTYAIEMWYPFEIYSFEG